MRQVTYMMWNKYKQTKDDSILPNLTFHEIGHCFYHFEICESKMIKSFVDRQEALDGK